MADQKVSALTLDSSPTTDDLLYTVNDPGGTPASRKTTLGNVATLIRKVVQVVNTETGAVSTGTTVIPFDDTIPQNTEGNEVMTLAITPTSSTNKLRIDVVVNFGNSSGSRFQIAALFQDTTADALAAASTYQGAGAALNTIKFTHYMTSGTTSSTTFKVRVGADASGTMTFNGIAGSRVFGGVMASSITITEIVP